MKHAFFLTFAAAAWGLNFHLAGEMMEFCSPIEGGFWRYTFGVLTLFLFTIGNLPSWNSIRGQIFPLLLIGLIGLFAFNYFFFLGLTYTSGLNAALIISLNPALTLLFSHFILGTRITRNHYLGIVVAFLGVAFLILKGNLSSISQLSFNQGDGWIMLANTIFALQHIWIKKYGSNLRNSHLTLVTNFFCLCGFVLVLPVFGLGQFTNYPANFWLASIGIGVIGTAIAYYFWNVGVKHVGPAKAGVFMNVVPLAAGLTSFAFGQSIQIIHLISGLIIITGIIIMQMNNLQKKGG